MEKLKGKKPSIRFPEFKGEWEKKKLGEVSDNIMYGMNSAAIPFDGENKYLRITDIDESSREFNPKPLVSPHGEIEEKYKLKYGDIVFTRTGASVGKTYLYNPKDGNLLFAGFLIKFSVTKGNPYFIFSQTLKEEYNKWVVKMSMRSGQPGLNAEECKDLVISFPTLPEQKKIANFLTAVDEKIQSLKKKKALLEQYKKGIMQKIFSQELRFKDDNGKKFPKWEKKKLGEVLEMVVDNRGKTPPVEKGGIPLLEVNSIGSKDVNYKAVSKFVNQETFKKWFRKYLKPGDVLFSTVGNTALCSYYDGKYKAVIAQNIVGFRFNEQMGLFMYYLLTEENNYKKMKSIEMGAVQPSIKVSQLTELFFEIPRLLEQTKIANFLSAIDEKINQTETQIQQMQEWKTG
ncbi:MAG: restriction endonuclease subunit S [Candidatus Kapaibacterium sp.]